MRTGTILIFIAIIMVILDITYGNIAWNDYDSKVGSDFERVKKTITIEEKSKIVDGLVLKFENSTLIDKYDAQFYKSDKYSFNVNLNTFKNYQLRLHELSQIDKNSLEYQTALIQINLFEKEQLKDVRFYGTFFHDEYFLIWDWICVLNVITICLLLIIGFAINDSSY